MLEDRLRSAGTPILPIEGAIFRPAGEPLPYTGHQSSPHGTTVADIILTIAPRVKLYSADVFGPTGIVRGGDGHRRASPCDRRVEGEGRKPVARRAGAQAATTAAAATTPRAIEEAYFRDVLVFAAAHNEHPITRSYPAAFAPPLISVDKGLFDDPLRFAYKLREQVEFQAHGRGYLGPFAREPATSWATPHLAGIASRILSLKPDLKPFEIKTVLYWLFRAGNAR